MTDYVIAKEETLASIADSIRNKTGGGGGIALKDFSTLIEDIKGGAEDICESIGADTYEVLNTEVLNTNSASQCFTLSNKISSLYNIALIIIIDKTSLTIPESTESSGELIFGFSYRLGDGTSYLSAVRTNTGINLITSMTDSILCGFSYANNKQTLDLYTTLEGQTFTTNSSKQVIIFYNFDE